MICRYSIRCAVLAALFVGGTALFSTLKTHAQPAPDTVVTDANGQVLAEFVDATSLAIDPAGRLYVTDAGADAVVQLTSDGTVQARYGGPGTRPGAFDDPADLDPTNGLVLYVADAGNARIQRFARAFQFLEALPVGSAAGADAQPTYDHQDANALAGGTGYPVAVVASNADELYVIDAAQGHIVQWELQRHTSRIIGGFNAGPGALRDPVALALGPESQLFVADRGRSAVLVFDAFGSFLNRYADGLAANAAGLRVVDGRLWLISPHAVQVIDFSGQLGRRWTVRLGAPLIDAARHAGQTYFLTARRLYRWAGS